jgi:hypothetical protein
MVSCPVTGKQVSLKSDIQDKADVLYVCPSQVLENRDEVEELVVVGIREPTADWHGMLGVENVGCRRVVDNDCLLEVATNLRKVLHIVSLVIVTTLAEQSMVDDLVDIQLIQKRVSILRHVRPCLQNSEEDRPYLGD